MKKILFILSLLFISQHISGQKMTAESFALLPSDLIALTEPRTDLNGKPCAVVRVGIALQGVVFDGNTIGKPVYNTGEYLVYIVNGSRQLTVRHDNYVPLTVTFSDYGIQRVESGSTYRLTVLTGNTSPQPQQRKGNFLVMNVTPTSSQVSIDNGGSTATDPEGSFKTFLYNGTHSYRVEAGDAYSPVSGTVEMKGERITIPITLQSVKASLSIKTTTSGTKIYVNEEYKGSDEWNGELTPGTYLVEAKKDGHRPFSTTVSLAKQQKKTIAIPALQASYGSLMVDYKPVDADVYLDNRLLGKTPDVFSNIVVGKHSVKISKAGYADYNGSVMIEENQQATVSGSLKRNSSDQNTNSFVQSSDTDTDTPEKLYQKGSSFYKKKDYIKAVKCFRKAAEQGHAVAQCYLGYCYDTGHGVSQDFSEAVKWYRKAADQGQADAQFNLGYCYKNGHGVSQDYSEGVKWYRKAAEQGQAVAQFNLGNIYKNGQGVSQDYTEAVKWYRMAAEQGHAVAQCYLGYCYDTGHGVSQDFSEAVKWYRKAADQGQADAQFNLGNSYEKGHGVSQDYTEAVKWYRKAAEQGDTDAQCNLGYCFNKGQGVSQDYSEGVKWYRKAAEQGSADAQFNLGYCYQCGQGVSQDYTEAVKWYRMAAEQGSASAQYNLGYCYQFGQGVSQDYTEAVKWYRKAAEQGDTDAQKQLESLKDKLR